MDNTKTLLYYSPLLNSSTVTFPFHPLPLSNVDLGSADSQETVCDPENNIESGVGGGGGGNMVVCLFASKNTWKGYLS